MLDVNFLFRTHLKECANMKKHLVPRAILAPVHVTKYFLGMIHCYLMGIVLRMPSNRLMNPSKTSVKLKNS